MIKINQKITFLALAIFSVYTRSSATNPPSPYSTNGPHHSSTPTNSSSNLIRSITSNTSSPSYDSTTSKAAENSTIPQPRDYKREMTILESYFPQRDSDESDTVVTTRHTSQEESYVVKMVQFCYNHPIYSTLAVVAGIVFYVKSFKSWTKKKK